MDFPWRTLARVEAWLRAQPDGAVVGQAASCGNCTLARCYMALSGLEIEVYPEHLYIVRAPDEAEELDTSPYEREFVDLHDANVFDESSDDDVTKEQALEFIELVREAA